MNSKRGSIIIFTIFTIFICLVARLYYIQVLSGFKLSRAAAAQRMSNAQVEKPRGDIIDRNDIPLTSRSVKVSVVLQPLYLKDKEEELKKLCNILELDYNKIKRQMEIKKEPILLVIDGSVKEKILDLKIQGVSIINSLNRYYSGSLARHLTGYLNNADKVGETGLEKFYDRELSVSGRKNISVVTDARNNLLQGLGYRIVSSDNREEALNVRLTIDYHIQEIVEEVMNHNNITGAVVIEDVYNGDILAMASKPDFDQNDVERYLDSTGNELFNKAVASYNIGSIFKIIDVAATLQANKYYNGEYYCNGFAKIGDKEFKCSSYEKGGHGYLEFKEAFALSCNPYFINMGLETGVGNMLEMARRFGLGEATGLSGQGVNESTGNLPIYNRWLSDGDIANISIGQGDIMVTPLQIADIIATIANGGIKNKISLVDSIIDSDGNIVKNIRIKEGKRVISKDVADRIKLLMEEVTRSGTGTKAAIERFGGSGGKTGSAETGQFVNGKKVTHAWFAGYFPRVGPRYSISVFIEDGKNGGQTAAPIFAEIAEEILSKGF